MYFKSEGEFCSKYNASLFDLIDTIFLTTTIMKCEMARLDI